MKKNLALILALVMLLGTVFSVMPMAEASGETSAPAVAYEPEISFANVNYTDKMYVSFAVPAPAALGEGEAVKLLVWGNKDDSKSFAYGDQLKKVLDAEAETVKIGEADYLVFKYDALTAADMTKIIVARAVLVKTVETTVEVPEVKDEQGKVTTPATTKTEIVTSAVAYSDIVEYSVLEYVAAAKGEFAGIAGLTDTAHLAVLDSMLAFGGLAQKYSGNDYEFLASDKLNKIWYTPVINGVAGAPVFGGFFSYTEDGFASVSAPVYNEYGFIGYFDAEGKELFDSDGLASNGVQLPAIDGDLNVTVKYGPKYMIKTDPNAATVDTVNLKDQGGGNKYAAGQGALGINCGAGNDGDYNYGGFDIIDDPYEAGNKVFRISGNTQYSIGMGNDTNEWKLSMKPTAVEGFNDTIAPVVTVDFTVARGANGQMPRTGNLRLRSDKNNRLTNIGYFEKGGTFMLYTSFDGSVVTPLPLKVADKGYTRYCFIVDFENEVLYAYAANEGEQLVYQAETRTPFLSGQAAHIAGDPWMNWANTLDRLEWMGGSAYNNFDAEEKATILADLDNNPETPGVPMSVDGVVNKDAVQWCYRNYRAMILKEYVTYVGSPVTTYAQPFDVYDIDANDATTTTKNSQLYVKNFSDGEFAAADPSLAGKTFGGIGINTSDPKNATLNPQNQDNLNLNYAGVDVIDDPYKEGNKVYSFNGNIGAVLWHASTVRSAAGITRPAYVDSLKLSTRVKGFFDGSVVPVITYDMLVGGNGYDRMLETDTIRMRGGSNVYVHLFKIAADGSILVCTANEAYDDAVFVDTNVDVRKNGYTRIVAEVDCGNEQFRLYAADEGSALKLVATIDTLWITSGALSRKTETSAPAPVSFATWMDMAKKLDRTEILIDNFGANELTAEELATVETVDAAAAQSLYRQYRALLIKDWDSYCGRAK